MSEEGGASPQIINAEDAADNNASPNQNFESPGEGMEGGDMEGAADYGSKLGFQSIKVDLCVR